MIWEVRGTLLFFYHIKDMHKVIERGPWMFEQNSLVLHQLIGNEDPQLVQLNKMDIWIQIYDPSTRMLTEKILQNIGNFVGVFGKSDPLNLNAMWKPYVRMRVTMDIGKPLKCRMKLKRKGGNWR